MKKFKVDCIKITSKFGKVHSYGDIVSSDLFADSMLKSYLHDGSLKEVKVRKKTEKREES